jgi:acyl dehydratase
MDDGGVEAAPARRRGDVDSSPVGAAATDGSGLPAVEHTVDERRLRAFAAGIGDLSAPLFDLDSPDGIVAHPVFPVVLEWPIVAAGPPGLGLDDDAVHAGLHVSHEIAWRRPIRPGDALRTTGRVEILEQRSAGLLAVFALVTTGVDGELVVESRQGILYRGSTLPADADGADAPPARPPRPQPPAAAQPSDDVATFRVDEADATIYSECSGIWNPIHTDPRAARAAGLPRPVLHGTATLARVVSALIETRLEGDPTRVARLACNFTAPISPGGRVTVSATQLQPLPGGRQSLTFTARKDEGSPILDDGFIEIIDSQARASQSA